jgi:hypothetical protein
MDELRPSVYSYNTIAVFVFAPRPNMTAAFIRFDRVQRLVNVFQGLLLGGAACRAPSLRPQWGLLYYARDYGISHNVAPLKAPVEDEAARMGKSARPRLLNLGVFVGDGLQLFNERPIIFGRSGGLCARLASFEGEISPLVDLELDPGRLCGQNGSAEIG